MLLLLLVVVVVVLDEFVSNKVYADAAAKLISMAPLVFINSNWNCNSSWIVRFNFSIALLFLFEDIEEKSYKCEIICAMVVYHSVG